MTHPQNSIQQLAPARPVEMTVASASVLHEVFQSRAFEIIRSLDEERLVEMMMQPTAVAPLTRAMRLSAILTVETYERLHLGFDHNLFSNRSDFVSEVEWAREVMLKTPLDIEVYEAQHRFAALAVSLPSPRDAVVALVTYLAKVLPAGGGPSPERMTATIETLIDHHDDAGFSVLGFSIPVLQAAIRAIYENQRWFPAPADFVAEARAARRFFRTLDIAARRQRDLVAEAEAILVANTPDEFEELPF